MAQKLWLKNSKFLTIVTGQDIVGQRVVAHQIFDTFVERRLDGAFNLHLYATVFLRLFHRTQDVAFLCCVGGCRGGVARDSTLNYVGSVCFLSWDKMSNI